MIEFQVDKTMLTKLQNKFEKYGPYAVKKGLEAATDYLNSPDVRANMYPARSYEPFVWSSEKQKRAYFATNGFGGGIPYTRTMQLYESAKFRINDSSFWGQTTLWIEYVSGVPYAKWVHLPSYQIIGHQTRKWPLITKYIVSKNSEVVKRFKPAALSAWDEMNSIMYGGGFGL